MNIQKIKRNKMKLSKALWFATGILSIGVAFIGVVVPGIPWSTPTVIAAYCFARSSDRMHSWLYNHPRFGPFLVGWQEKRIFPQRLKYLMLVTMLSTVLITWIATGNDYAALWTGGFMILVAVWAWRYPSSEEEYRRRVDAGRKVAWLR
jgi:uncharacterized membrane protein YbaN (DUF454 family)